MSPSPPFSSVAFGPSVWVLMMMFWPVFPAPFSQPQTVSVAAPDGDVRGEHERRARLAARREHGQLGAGRVADPHRGAARIARGRQAGCRRIARDERVVLVDHLVVGQPGPGHDHAEHPGVPRVEQRNRVEYALPDGMGQRGSVGRVVHGGLSGGLARLVAADRRLARIQREHRRRGPHQRDPAPGRCPERLGEAAGGQVDAKVDEVTGHPVGWRLPGVGVVVGQRDRARPAHGRGNAHRQGEVAGQPAVEGEPVGPHAEPGDRGELPGEPVHIGHVTAAARVTGSEPDELLLPLPHLGQARHARGRTTGFHAHSRSSLGGWRQRAGGTGDPERPWC